MEIGGGSTRVLAPIAPGVVQPIEIASHRRLAIGQMVDVECTRGVLALDGEREIPLRPGERLRVRLSDRGPRVVEVGVALRLSVERGLFDAANSHQRVDRAPRALAG